MDVHRELSCGVGSGASLLPPCEGGVDPDRSHPPGPIQHSAGFPVFRRGAARKWTRFTSRE
ncbi:hypothetical protein D187_006312 [Cystobacter fuscus DSM 2262]|uniref:Uncharacterized protein n=1 Tax=Cystobacter fuscus (strain ATCC 25194 / DSM 2262 / NBRC 100088 / M29) TaxID=1242864 RepID=S9PKB8_CYSF2|nr:hypothetical protein D187_006312 [Cystobacter fuscus DSM 2262]